MPKEEWGTKRVCPTTGKRFYDLNRTPVVSPYTGEVVPTDEAQKSRVAIADKADKSTEKEPELAEEEEVVVEAEDNTEVDIEDDILEDEDDDSVSLDDIADVSSEDEER